MTAITGKNIWIIGASSGIGYALAKSFALSGNVVFVTARAEDKLNVLQQVRPSHISPLPGDVTDPQALDKMAASLLDAIDTLDMVLLCAGTCEYEDDHALDIDMYRRVFDVNFFAAVSCTKIALPLLKRTAGRIVGISSLSSVVPFPRAEAYGASKAAFEYFLQSLSIDLRGTGVDVCIVRPGFVDTPLTQKNDFDMPFLVDTEFAAEKIIKGLERDKKVISFPWQMSASLSFFSHFKSLWMHIIAKQFRKSYEV